MLPRRLAAAFLVVFSAGFLLGYWYHQPVTPIRDAEIVASIQQASRETDRILAEQRKLFDCPINYPAPTSPPPKATPRAPGPARPLKEATP
jgi:hypothetical protein